MTVVDPLKDRLDIYSDQLGTVAEASPTTLIKYTLKQGNNITLTQNTDGTWTIAAIGGLQGPPGPESTVPGPQGPPGTVPLTPGVVGSYATTNTTYNVILWNSNGVITTTVYVDAWWTIPTGSYAQGTWQIICRIISTQADPGTGNVVQTDYYQIQRIA